MKSLQIPLQLNLARQYLEKQLHDGNTLAQSILKILPLDEGHYFALLHPSANQKLVYQFESGGILPENPIEPVKFAGKIYPGRKKSNSNLELIIYLKTFINSKSFYYFDDQMHRKEDPIAMQYQADTLRYNEELYLFLNASNFSTQYAERIIRHVNARWYYMNIISEEDPGKSVEISIEKLVKITSKTTHIVVGAYDGEGYLIWQRANLSASS